MWIRKRYSGWSLVRRPTGGRAILHTDELTYSVTGPHSEPRLAGSVLESYRVLSRALLRALLLLEIPAEAQEKPHPLPSVPPPSPQSGEGGGDGGVGEVNPICFEVPSNYEITVSGKKLVGSAQSRRKEGVLQHGSLPLYGDLARITQALVFPDEAARQEAALRLLGRAATAEQVLGWPLDWETAAQAFASAFEQALQLKLETGEPTEEEMRHAERLVVEKYANQKWTERV
jgi:lipoate-protein ligase A